MALAVMAADKLYIELFTVVSYFDVPILFYIWRSQCNVPEILPPLPAHQELGYQISVTN